ncbi:MAG: OmpA family protein [Bacteroidetes bacterium]|nr:OmpA family protein [Bacteroidota bacterium]
MKFKSQITLGLAAMIGLNSLSAQVDTTKKASFLDKLSVGVNVASVLTYTDIKQYNLGVALKYHSEQGWGAGVNAMYTFSPVFALQGQLNWGDFHGSNRQKNMYFDGGFIEPTLNVHLNLSNMFFPTKVGKSKLTSYAYLGLGLNSFRSTLHELKTNKLIAYQGYSDLNWTKDKATREVVFPVGFGLKYKINSHLGITLESSVRYLNTDKFDAIVLGTRKDSYTYSSLGAVYSFSGKAQVTDASAMEEKLAAVSELIDGFGDKDGDGIADKYDKDNNTPKGAKAYGDGTSVDTDGDGVPDYMDQERFSANGAKVNENGVEVDADGDGVGDSRDLEPNTAKGAQVDAKGVTIQTGGSAIAPAKTDGGSAYQPSGLPSIYFQVNSTVVEYNNYPAMTTIAQALKANPKLKLVVVGHADNVGSPEYNKKLALKRAEAVVNHLVKVYGIDKARLVTDSKGNADVLTKGNGSIVDRRVDFSIGK